MFLFLQLEQERSAGTTTHTEIVPGTYAIVRCGKINFVGVILAVEGDRYAVKYMKPSGRCIVDNNSSAVGSPSRMTLV